VTAASRRRRLLASVVVSYTAVSTTTDATTLTTGLSNSATISAIASSLSTAGYPGVSVSSPVIGSSSAGAGAGGGGGGGSAGGSSSSSGSASGSSSSGGSNVAIIAGGVVGGLVLIAVAILVPVLVMHNKKKPASDRFELTPEVNLDPNELVSLDQQQPQRLLHPLESLMMDDIVGQGNKEEESMKPLHHDDVVHEESRGRSDSRSEKSSQMSSIDNRSIHGKDSQKEGSSIGAAAFFNRPRNSQKSDELDDEQEHRQKTDVNNKNTTTTNNNNGTSFTLSPPQNAWTHAMARMSQLRPKSITNNDAPPTSVVMSTQLVTGIESDSDDFRASFVAAVTSTINEPNSIVRVMSVTKVDTGISVVYKIANHAVGAQSIEQTLSSGVATMSEELQKKFPGTAVVAPRVIQHSSSSNKPPLPRPRSLIVKQAQVLPPKPPQPQVVEVTLSMVGVTNSLSSSASPAFRALMMDSLVHMLPPNTKAEIVRVSVVKGRTSVVCKIATDTTAVNADNLVATLQSPKNMMSLTKDLRTTFPTAVIAPPVINVLTPPTAIEEGEEEEEKISSSFGMGDLYREKRLHEIAHRRPSTVQSSAAIFVGRKQGPPQTRRPFRIAVPEETQWIPPSWTTPDGQNIRITDEEMHMMDVQAARRQALHRHSVTSIDSQYTDIWKHTRNEDAANDDNDDDKSMISLVQCDEDENEDTTRAMLMEKIYAQDDEFNDVMAEIMRSEFARYETVTGPSTLGGAHVKDVRNIYETMIKSTTTTVKAAAGGGSFPSNCVTPLVSVNSSSLKNPVVIRPNLPLDVTMTDVHAALNDND